MFVRGSVSGKVVQISTLPSAPGPLPNIGVPLGLLDDDENIIQVVYTDTDGEFSFSPIIAGDYTVVLFLNFLHEDNVDGVADNAFAVTIDRANPDPAGFMFTSVVTPVP